MIHQLWGPFADLVGDGGYSAWTLGSWFVLKYSNVLMYVAVAALFVVGMVVNLPGRTGGQQ